MAMKLRLLPLLLAASVSVVAFADGNSDSKTINTGVQIISPISITKTADLSFGTLIAAAGRHVGAVVTVSTGGVQTIALASGISRYSGTGGTPAGAASFSIGGEDGYAFNFTIPNFVVRLDLDGSTLPVTPNYAVVGDGLFVTHSNIPAVITVGGVLALDDAKPGVWSGTFNPQVNYL
jgi:hypothetical protein